jgi:lysozyme
MILGIDVSKWQKELDWLIASSAGARFAFIRAGSITLTGGNCYTDYQFERNAEIAPDYFPIGFYWYFRPYHDPIKQANYFCDLIKDKKWKLPPVLDLEEAGNLSPLGVTTAAGTFVLKVKERLNVLPLLYSRAYWLNKNTVPNDLMKLLGLWIARYTSKGKPWGNILPWPDSPGIKPRDYNGWRFWQKSAGGNGRGKEFGAVQPGASVSIDIDYFNGDQAALDSYAGEKPPDPTTESIYLEFGGNKYIGEVKKV